MWMADSQFSAVFLLPGADLAERALRPRQLTGRGVLGGTGARGMASAGSPAGAAGTAGTCFAATGKDVAGVIRLAADKGLVGLVGLVAGGARISCWISFACFCAMRACCLKSNMASFVWPLATETLRSAGVFEILLLPRTSAKAFSKRPSSRDRPSTSMAFWRAWVAHCWSQMLEIS